MKATEEIPYRGSGVIPALTFVAGLTLVVIGLVKQHDPINAELVVGGALLAAFYVYCIWLGMGKSRREKAELRRALETTPLAETTPEQLQQKIAKFVSDRAPEI